MANPKSAPEWDAASCKRRLNIAEEYFLPKIAAGDGLAIRQLLSIIAETILKGGYFPSGIASFLAGGLSNIADDKGELSAPFGVKRGRGEKRRHTVVAGKQRDFSRAYRVECHVHDGKSVDEAIGLVAMDESAAEDTVRGAWKRQHKLAKHEIAMQIKYLGEVIRIT